MGMLRAGKLDRRIRIERDGPPVHDGLQNVPGSPMVLATVWAEYRPAKGGEKFEAAETAATGVAIYRVRWQQRLDPNTAAGISPKDRIRFPARDDGRLFEIVSAIEIGRREGIEIAVIGRTDR